MKTGGVKGNLYIVATPIGNLEDITLRSLKILKSVDFIICEDTRTTIKLLRKYDINKKMYSYYSPKEKMQAVKYLNIIEAGNDIALVSESGTPCISDPGVEIVKKAYEKGIKVIPVPGPSAFVACLSAAGISTKEVFFAGFVPRKKGQRKKYLENHLKKKYTFVFYESKYRMKDTLRFIKDIAPELSVCIGREITKKFEEFMRGNITEVEKKVSEVNNLKGEFVVICSGLKK